jgi:transcriptional regulator with XRE-family HTH domain
MEKKTASSVSVLAQRLGTKLRTLRQREGLTQEELAEKLDMHPSYPGQLERGETNPSFQTLEKLSAFFKVQPSEFVNDEDSRLVERKKQCEKLLQKFNSRQWAALH